MSMTITMSMFLGFWAGYAVSFGLMKLGAPECFSGFMGWLTFFVVWFLSAVYSAVFSPWAKAEEKRNQQAEHERWRREEEKRRLAEEERKKHEHEAEEQRKNEREG